MKGLVEQFSRLEGKKQVAEAASSGPRDLTKTYQKRENRASGSRATNNEDISGDSRITQINLVS